MRRPQSVQVAGSSHALIVARNSEMTRADSAPGRRTYLILQSGESGRAGQLAPGVQRRDSGSEPFTVVTIEQGVVILQLDPEQERPGWPIKITRAKGAY